MEEANVPDDIIRQIFDEMHEDLKAKKTFVGSEEFFETLKTIKKFFADAECESQKYIDDEFILYSPRKYPISHKLLCKTVDSVLLYPETLDNVKDLEEPNNTFTYSVKEYDGLVFRLLVGQGSALQIWDSETYRGSPVLGPH